jgi:hypothetical protein
MVMGEPAFFVRFFIFANRVPDYEKSFTFPVENSCTIIRASCPETVDLGYLPMPSGSRN